MGLRFTSYVCPVALVDQYGLITVNFCDLHCVGSKVDPITVVAAVEIIKLLEL